MVQSSLIARPPRLGEDLACALRDVILREGLREGDRLPTEKELALRYGVSRTVVREAVARLQTDGLVTARQGSGVFVARPSPIYRMPAIATRRSRFQSVYELRLGVESAAAELAAARREAHHLAELESRIAAMADPERRSEADMQFHVGVARATGNPLYETFVGFIGGELATVIGNAVLNTMLRHPGQVEQVIAEHRAVLNAIAAQDGPAARQAMNEHLRSAAQRLRIEQDMPD